MLGFDRGTQSNIAAEVYKEMFRQQNPMYTKYKRLRDCHNGRVFGRWTGRDGYRHFIAHVAGLVDSMSDAERELYYQSGALYCDVIIKEGEGFFPETIDLVPQKRRLSSKPASFNFPVIPAASAMPRLESLGENESVTGAGSLSDRCTDMFAMEDVQGAKRKVYRRIGRSQSSASQPADSVVSSRWANDAQFFTPAEEIDTSKPSTHLRCVSAHEHVMRDSIDKSLDVRHNLVAAMEIVHELYKTDDLRSLNSIFSGPEKCEDGSDSSAPHPAVVEGARNNALFKKTIEESMGLLSPEARVRRDTLSNRIRRCELEDCGRPLFADGVCFKHHPTAKGVMCPRLIDIPLRDPRFVPQPKAPGNDSKSLMHQHL